MGLFFNRAKTKREDAWRQIRTLDYMLLDMEISYDIAVMHGNKHAAYVHSQMYTFSFKHALVLAERYSLPLTPYIAMKRGELEDMR